MEISGIIFISSVIAILLAAKGKSWSLKQKIIATCVAAVGLLPLSIYSGASIWQAFLPILSFVSLFFLLSNQHSSEKTR